MKEGTDIIPATELEHWAALGRLDRVQAVLESGVDVNVKGQNGYTALHAAAENGHVSVLKLLLKRGADVSPRLASGEIPLDLALRANQREAAEVLRQHEAEHAAGSPNEPASSPCQAPPGFWGEDVTEGRSP